MAGLASSISSIVASRMKSKLDEKKKKYGKTMDAITGKKNSMDFADNIVESISNIGKKKKKKYQGLPSRQMRV